MKKPSFALAALVVAAMTAVGAAQIERLTLDQMVAEDRQRGPGRDHRPEGLPGR
jgi:hypothetical protein